MEEPLPPPGSQPHSSKCGEGDIFFTIIAENILGLVLMDSDKVLGQGCEQGGPNWLSWITYPPLDSGGGIGSL